MNAQDIYTEVGKRYTAAAKGVDEQYGKSIATAFGYSELDLAGLPKDANLGLSCGNPLVIATLREGETVIDLGSGAGFDVFQAAKKVGPTGRAIGVEMNKDMLAKAENLKVASGLNNVEFVESRITEIALADGIADCIISNCVINLVPEEEKPLVFNEIFRLLKPGGRVAISDILAKKALPEHIKNSMALYVGCIAGASPVPAYEKYLNEAGFKEILIEDSGNDLNVYRMTTDDAEEGCCTKQEKCGDPNQKNLPELPDIDFNEWTASYKIYAVKT